MTDQRRSRYTNTIISTSKQKTWLPLCILMVIGLVGMHFTVSRPMRKQWEEELLAVRRDLNRMQGSVQRLASIGTQTQKTNSLLTAMNDQQSLVRESQKTLKLVDDLTLEIGSRAENLAKSLATVDELAELQARIVERSESSLDALAALDLLSGVQTRLIAESRMLTETEDAIREIFAMRDRTLEATSDLVVVEKILVNLSNLKTKLVAQSQDLDEAEEVARRYADLKDTLTIAAEDLPIAERNLDRWIGIQDRIVGESTKTKTAQNNLTALLAVQNRLTQDVSNVESARRSHEGMSRKILNFASLHPVVANAIRALEPFAEHVKSGDANRKAAEGQASLRTSEQSPLVAPKPREKHRGFFPEWVIHSIGNQ